jgi:hypothetical protein
VCPKTRCQEICREIIEAKTRRDITPASSAGALR